MGFDIKFDYVTSEWNVHYWEDNKTSLQSRGRTLDEALKGLKSSIAANQIRTWLGITKHWE